MDERTESSFGLLRDSRRDSWILTCPVGEWRALRPPAVSAERRVRRVLGVEQRHPGILAPLVILVLTVATAALLHALR